TDSAGTFTHLPLTLISIVLIGMADLLAQCYATEPLFLSQATLRPKDNDRWSRVAKLMPLPNVQFRLHDAYHTLRPPAQSFGGIHSHDTNTAFEQIVGVPV